MNLDIDFDNLIFLHIPKAAGSTFHTIIQKYYPHEKTIHFQGSNTIEETKEFINQPEDFRNKIRLLKGHMHFGLHKYLYGRTKYITFFRKPVERLVSHYNYAKRTENHYLHNKIIENDLSIDDYLDNDLSLEFINGQSRMIAFNFDDILSVKYRNINDKELLEKAKQNIQNYFLFCGLKEYFDESLIMIKEKLGWKKNPYYMTRNVTKSGKTIDDLSESTKNRIINNNRVDIELYHYIEKQMLIEIKSTLGFIKKLNKFRRKNKLRNKTLVPILNMIKEINDIFKENFKIW